MAEKLRRMATSVGSAFDLFGVGASPQPQAKRERYVIQSFLRDAMALEGDWRIIGSDISKAFLTSVIHGEKAKTTRKSA